MSHRVALLTNFIPPYRVPLLGALQVETKDLRIFVSVRMESNRDWLVEWGGLQVSVQRCVTLERTWRHPHSFSEPNFIHIPYDTLALLRRYRPEVVISAEMGARTLQSALYRRLNPKSRLIIWATLSEYTEQGRGKARDLLRKHLLHVADAIIVNGESGARYIRRFGTDDAKIFRVPQTTHIGSFSIQRSPKKAVDVLRFLSVGHLNERKGVLPFAAVLCRLAAEHPTRKLELRLVGEGPLRTLLETMDCPPNLEVHISGFVSYDQLPAVYSQADVFVLPTLADEWGIVVNEAMAAGLPVLGSIYSQAVEELVEDGACGWIFRPDDSEDMADAIQRVLSASSESLVAMGRAGQLRVSHLTPKAVARSIADVISFTIPGS